MAALQAEVQKRLTDPEVAAAWQAATGGTPEQCPPIYSFDNPSIHKNNKTYLAELGLAHPGSDKPTDTWLKLPPYSGDLHRTIERVHARVCGIFQRWLDDEFTEWSMEQYCHTLQGIFYKSQTPALIQGCMKNIHLLYSKVIELKGAKAPRPFC